MELTIAKEKNLNLLNSVLPYMAISNNMIISEKPDQITAILELYVSEMDSRSSMQFHHDNLMATLCDLMPDDSYATVYYSKIYVNENLPYKQKSDFELVNYLQKIRIDEINTELYPKYMCFLSITIPVAEKDTIAEMDYNEDELVDYTDEERSQIRRFKTVSRRLDQIIRSLKGRIHGNIIRLSSSQILSFISTLINHSVNTSFYDLSSIVKSDFNSTTSLWGNEKDYGYIYYGGNYHTVLSQRSMHKTSRLPKYSHAGMNEVFNAEVFKDIPFTVQHTIKFINRRKGMALAEGRKNSIERGVNFGKHLAIFKWFISPPEGISPELLKEKLERTCAIVENNGNIRFVEQFFHIHLWHNNVALLEKLVDDVQKGISHQYMMKKEKENIRVAWFSMFPGNEYKNPIRTLLASYNVADFLPIDLPKECFVNTESPDYVYFNHECGSVSRFDLFDDRCNAYNAIVAGGTGSGKSFLVNSALLQFMAAANPKVAIIDYAGEGQGSYRNIILNNNGTYIEISANNPFSINPFDGELFLKYDAQDPDSIEVDQVKMEGLENTIERMVGTKDEKGTSFQPIQAAAKAVLNKCIKKYYKDENNNINNTCSLNHFAETYLKNNNDLIAAGRDLYIELKPFIGTGIEEGLYAAYFRKTDEIKNRDLICFDLAGLKDKAKLANVLIPTLLEMITNNIMKEPKGVKKRRKLVIMDEAWSTLKGGTMAEFMEKCFATIRKENGAITIITQNIQSIKNSPIADSIFINTSYFYLIGPNHVHKPDETPPLTPLKFLEAKGKGGDRQLTDYDINKILTQKPKRDFYLLTPFFSGKMSFKPQTEFIMLCTTDPNHKALLGKYKQKHGCDFVSAEVIKDAKDEFEKTFMHK